MSFTMKIFLLVEDPWFVLDDEAGNELNGEEVVPVR